MPASNATFVGEIDGAARASTSRSRVSGRCGTSPTAPWPAREVAAYARVRGPRLGHRAADDAARRPARARAWCSCGRSPTRRQRRGRPRAGRARCRDGFRHVFDGLDDPRPARCSLVHEDRPRCGGWRSSTSSSTTPTARAGTCSPMPDGHRYGVDHGVTFHVEHKLRTVLWGWAGEPLPRRSIAGVEPGARRAGRRRWRRRLEDAAPPQRGRGGPPPLPSGCSRPAAARSRGTGGRSSPGRRSEAVDRLRRHATLVLSRASRHLPVTGPRRPGPRHRTGGSSRPGPRARPGSTSAASRRTTRPTWATPRRTSPSTCSTAPGARAGHEVAYVQNVTDVDDPLLERADEGRGRLGRAGRARDRAVPRTTWRRCASCRRTQYVGAVESIPLVVDLIERLQEAGAVYEVDERPLLLGHRRPRLRRGLAAGPATRCCGSSPSAGETPTARARSDPLDCVVWRGERDGRAGVGQPVRPRPARAGTSSAPRSRSSTSAAPSTSRAAAATWSSRTTRCPPARRRSPTRASAFARAYAHAGMVAYDGEKMSKSKGNLVFVSRAAQQRRRPDGHPARAAAATTTAATGSGPTTSCGTPVDTAGPVAQGAVAGRRRARCAGRRRRARGAGRRPRRPDRRSRPSTTGRPRRWATRPTGSPTRATRTPRRPLMPVLDAAGRSARRQPAEPVTVTQSSVAPLEVALELARDRLAAGLGQVGGVARLLERADVVGDVLVLLGELVDAALPGPGVLGQLAERDASSRAGPRAGRSGPAWPWGTGGCAT